MKRLFLLQVFLSIYTSSTSQKLYYPPYDQYLAQTKSVMGILHIKIRDSLHKDEFLYFVVDSTLKEYGKFKTAYKNGVVFDCGDNERRTRFYLQPRIHLRPSIDSIVFKGRDTTKFAQVMARSIVIHELCHYLEEVWTPDDAPPIKSKREYYSRVGEFTAYSACAYYFYRNYNKRFLKRVMRSKKSMKCKMVALVNRYLRDVVEWDEDILICE
jgi:hypothetical protein